jgi:hypothetical protein
MPGIVVCSNRTLRGSALRKSKHPTRPLREWFSSVTLVHDSALRAEIARKGP